VIGPAAADTGDRARARRLIETARVVLDSVLRYLDPRDDVVTRYHIHDAEASLRAASIRLEKTIT
jgi:hypothetical protein